METKNEHDGPVQVLIPEVRYMTCQGCKWHTYTEFEDADEFPGPPGCMVCKHPDIGDEYVPKGGYYAPDWCPYLKVETKEQQNGETRNSTNNIPR